MYKISLKSRFKNSLCAALFILGGITALAVPNDDRAKPETNVLKFAGVEFLHRWNQRETHEFTPKGQEDLDHWTNMVTINYYREATDGEMLSGMANAVLENYKKHGATVLKTDAVPMTPTKPAEYLIVVAFVGPNFAEAAFARFKIVNGVGLSVVYSYRTYGDKPADQINAWLQANGLATENALMSLDPIPVFAAEKPVAPSTK